MSVWSLIPRKRHLLQAKSAEKSGLAIDKEVSSTASHMMLDTPANERNKGFRCTKPTHYSMDSQPIGTHLAQGVEKSKAGKRPALTEQQGGKVDETRSSQCISSDLDGGIRNPFRKDKKSGKAETDLQHYERLRSRFENIEGMNQASAPAGDGSVMFDKTSGALWHRARNGGNWERAVFHYWIRDDIREIEDSKGEDVDNLEHGILSGDVTCFCAFKRRPINRARSAFPVGNLLYGGNLVIDYSLSPVRAFPEFPMVLSSQYAGSEMLAAQLQNSAIRIEDFRARMPPVVQESVDGRLVLKPLYSVDMLSERIRQARVVPGPSTSTHQVPDPENLQRFNLLGEVAYREASGATQKQDNLAKEQAEIPIIQRGQSPKAAAPPKFAPMDQSDSRNLPPANAREAMALWEALHPTADHFFQLTGREPSRNEGRSAPNYCMQWMDMQNQLRQLWEQTPPAPYLVSRRKWTGGVANWRSGQLSMDA